MLHSNKLEIFLTRILEVTVRNAVRTADITSEGFLGRVQWLKTSSELV